MKYMAMKIISGRGSDSTLPPRHELTCAEAGEWLSPYLDGAVTGTEMHRLQRHLTECSRCTGEFQSLRSTQRLLSEMPGVSHPADLGLKLRLAISREAALARRGRYEGMRVRLEDTLRAFMVPATAGLVCALLIFGLVTAILAMPGPLQANTEDVPLVLNTGPELQQSVFSTSLSSMDADSLVIEAYVDQNGRIQDYKILSDSSASQQLLPEVKRMLIFTTFRPAMSMGHPISSRAVLSFAKINVRG